jgi:hypothetical protein
MLKDFRHESEKESLSILSKNITINAMMTVANSIISEVSELSMILDRGFFVTRSSFPRLHRIFHTAMEKLEITDNVLLFLNNDYNLSVKTFGGDGYYTIVCNSSCISEYTDEQLMALFGHELAHIGCGHIEYLQLVEYFDSISKKFGGDFIGAALTSAKTVLYNWFRYAYYSADRAAAICAGSVKPVIEILGSAMGMSKDSRFVKYDIPALLRTAENKTLPTETGVIPQILVQSFLATSPTPYASLRLKEIYKWVQTDSCLEVSPQVFYNGMCYYVDFTKLITPPEKITKEFIGKMHFSAYCGDKEAITYLGNAYLQGKIIPRDIYIGLEYIKKAADLGDPEAITILGKIFSAGLAGFIPQNVGKASLLLRYAAGKGYLEAQNLISIDKSFYDYKERMGKIIAACKETFKKTNPEYDFQFIDDSPYNLESKEIKDKLLIPDKDILHAFEKSEEFDRIFAVTDTGVFYKTGLFMPEHITWKTLIVQDLTAVTNHGIAEVMSEGDLIYSCDKLKSKQSIFGFIYIVKKNF